ncbi:MAG TPA: response regulator [Burkholderiales bacterium]|nr:response regulator [Burkholderiales bacterium]
MIILVDDNADHRLVLRMALELAGYRVREAAHGAEALRLQRERTASFLITDIFMPEADGFETIAAFRREFPQTRIIAVSGGGQRAKRDYLEAATLMGVDAAFHKPFEIERLLAALRLLGERAEP